MVIEDRRRKIMENPIKVLEMLDKDFGALMLRQRLLPPEKAAELKLLESAKENIIKLKEKFSKTDYHTIYNKRIKKDSIQEIISRLGGYGIKLNDHEKAFLSHSKKGGIPKLKRVVSEIKKIKKEVKKKYSGGEFQKLRDIVKRGSENVAARRMHSNLLTSLGKKRLEILKESIIKTSYKKIQASLTGNNTDEIKKLAEAQKKTFDRLKEIDHKIKASEQVIQELQSRAKNIVNEFIIISEKIRQSTKQGFQQPPKKEEMVLTK